MIYAIIKDKVVQNIIEAESHIAFHVLFPEADEFIMVTPDSGFPFIGLALEMGKFQPSSSWVFDSESASWVAQTEPEA